MKENKTIQRRPLAELNLIDDFMFTEMVTQENEEDSIRFCKILIEAILNRKLGVVKVIPQKIQQGLDTALHGICMDVSIEAVTYDEGEEISDISVSPDVYDIEPNCYPGNEPRRMRFYNALTDSRSLQAGTDYSELPNSYMVMITPHDPFGMDSMVYTCRVRCEEIPEMPYDDGVTYIYLYTRGTKNVPSQKVADVLRFMEDSTPSNAEKQAESRVLWEMMEEVKKRRKVGVRYLKACEIIDMNKKKGKIEGFILASRDYGASDSEIVTKLQVKFRISEETAKKALADYDAEYADMI